MKEFLIADTHFNHERIIAYSGRPFLGVKHMQQEIIRRWNERVSDKDRVTVLGDFAFLRDGTEEEVTRIIDQLNGKICLLLGNHDIKSVSKWEQVGIQKVVKKGKWDFLNLLLSHYPIPRAEMVFSDRINVHGHTHNHTIPDGKHVCVCVEYTNYYPVLLDEVKYLLKKQMY